MRTPADARLISHLRDIAGAKADHRLGPFGERRNHQFPSLAHR